MILCDSARFGNKALYVLMSRNQKNAPCLIRLDDECFYVISVTTILPEVLLNCSSSNVHVKEVRELYTSPEQTAVVVRKGFFF